MLTGITYPADIKLAVAVYKRQRQVCNYLSSHTIGQEQIPSPSVQSDADILHFILENVAPMWHAAATFKMGGDMYSRARSKDKSVRTQGLADSGCGQLSVSST